MLGLVLLMATNQSVFDQNPFHQTEAAPSSTPEQNLFKTISDRLASVLNFRKNAATNNEELVSAAVAEGMKVAEDGTDLSSAELRRISDKLTDLIKSVTASVAGGKGRLSLSAITTLVASTAALLVVTYGNDAKAEQLNLKLEQQKTTLNLQSILDKMDSLEGHFINMLAKADLVQGKLDTSNLDDLFTDYDPQLDLLQLVVSEEDLNVDPRLPETENELYKFLQTLAAKGEQANKPVASVRLVLQEMDGRVDDITIVIDRSTTPPTSSVKIHATSAVRAAKWEILAGLASRALGLSLGEDDIFYDPASRYIPAEALTLPRVTA